METTLLTPREVDLLLQYPAGRTSRLTLDAKIPHVTLPNGEIRIDQREIDKMLARRDTPAGSMEVPDAR